MPRARKSMQCKWAAGCCHSAGRFFDDQRAACHSQTTGTCTRPLLMPELRTTWKASRTNGRSTTATAANGKKHPPNLFGKKHPPLMQIHLHPWRLTWTPNFSMLERELVLQTIISRLHVGVWECIQKKNASTCLLKMSFSQLMVWLSGLGCWFGFIGIPENERDATPKKKSTNRKCEKAPPTFHQHPPLSGRI